MKATGIVRRIDDLGRVVIPKEIRRTMRIREGDPLEIYTNSEGEVIFKKYSPINEMSETASNAADVIHKLSGSPVIVFDRDHVVAVSGVQKKEYIERRLSQALEELIQARRSWVCDSSGDSKPISPVEGVQRPATAIAPIIAAGDIAGAVCILVPDKKKKKTQSSNSGLMLTLAQTAAMFLAKQLEE